MAPMPKAKVVLCCRHELVPVLVSWLLPHLVEAEAVVGGRVGVDGVVFVDVGGDGDGGTAGDYEAI